jgi:hypothetical protein
MNYVLETISKQDQAIIVHGAAEKFGHLYASRDGYFRPDMIVEWATDRAAKSYLLAAPTLIARREIHTFHFFFDGLMYSVQLVGESSMEIQVVNYPQETQTPAFQAALVEALDVLGYRFRRFPNLKS